MALSIEKIEALAPDQSSLAAARKLLKPGGWPTLADDGAGLIWGECQGSGATPYRVAVTEVDAGYKCTCPSRKFPCKHALALMWLRTEGSVPFVAGVPPQWVEDWLGRRRGPVAAPKPDPDAPPRDAPSIAALADEPQPEANDPAMTARAEAQRERNRLQREALIADGLDALDRWIADQLERGLAGFDQRAQIECATLARRLVDAKAGGLANRVEQLPALLFASDEAARGRVAAQQLGLLHLLASAYRRQDRLDAALRADVRQMIGWTVARDALLADADALRIDGQWIVLATVEEVQPDRLRRIETWLALRDAGAALRFAVLIDFVPVSTGIGGNAFAPGEVIDATLAFYPSAVPLRALIAAQRDSRIADGDWAPPAGGLAGAWAGYQAALAARPWLGDWPIAARDVTIRAAGGRLFAVADRPDGVGEDLALPLAAQDAELAAPLLDAGTIALFGLWDGQMLKPRFATTPLGRWTLG